MFKVLDPQDPATKWKELCPQISQKKHANFIIIMINPGHVNLNRFEHLIIQLCFAIKLMHFLSLKPSCFMKCAFISFLPHSADNTSVVETCGGANKVILSSVNTEWLNQYVVKNISSVQVKCSARRY